jgi:hypothetical protein
MGIFKDNVQMTTVSQKYLLQNERLTVEVAHPGGAYSGTRFDWSAFITQITLDGKHTFCMPESLIPGQGSGGIGLCNEFGIDAPIGYAEAQPGDCFPKLGVGLLRRPVSDEYNFGLLHEFAEHFAISAQFDSGGLHFSVQSLDCRGYAAILHKTLTLNANKLCIAYELQNVGSLPIRTNEYCHNFVGFDQKPIGPDYQLRFPYSLTLEQMGVDFMEHMQPMLNIHDNTINPQPLPNSAFYCRPLGYAHTDLPQWELEHKPSGITMREYDDFTPCRVAVWGTPHVISAEVFVQIDIAPGQTQKWTRIYEFNA